MDRNVPYQHNAHCIELNLNHCEGAKILRKIIKNHFKQSICEKKKSKRTS